MCLVIMHSSMLMHLNMHPVSPFEYSSIDVCLCSWGCLPGCIGVRRVLFVGPRDGDVTPSFFNTMKIGNE